VHPRSMNQHPFPVATNICLYRRTLLRWAVASGAALVTMPAWQSPRAFGQDAKGAANLAPLNRFSRMVQEWFVEQVKDAEAKIKQRLAGPKTEEGAEAY